MASSTPPFLSKILSNYGSKPPENRPHVTLTFAQSIDAKIGDAYDRQLVLSGKESMIMTHWMRTMHDAILIGIGTALKDDPQLNVRHLPPPEPSSQSRHLPRPIIIDSTLRLSPTCKLLKNYRSGTGRRPWILCPRLEGEVIIGRSETLKAAGAKIVDVGEMNADSDDYKSFSVPSILRALRRAGVSSVMVEGGARIIGSFLEEYQEPLVDTLIVTIAPVLVGNDGVAYNSPTSLSEAGVHKRRFQEAHTEMFGKDTVIALTAMPP